MLARSQEYILLQQKIFYPFLLCLYFIFFVFAENLGEVYLGDSVRPVAILFLLTGAFLLLFRLVFGSFDRAAFITALLLALLFVHTGLEQLLPRVLGRNLIALLSLEVIVLGAIGFITLRKVSNWSMLNQTLNLTAGVLLVLALYRIGSYGMSDEGAIFAAPLKHEIAAVEGFTRPAGKPPNIYYLLVDAYTRSDTLRDYFGYDNSDFLDYLQDTGFKVSDKSVANYNLTGLAVSSLLNMEYMGDENGFTKYAPNGMQSLFNEKIYNNRVAGVLSELGYRVVTLRSSGKYVIMGNAENLTLDSDWFEISEFESALLGTTLLPRILERIVKDVFSSRDRVEFVLDEITRRAADPEPTFMVAHIFAPHQPFIFDRDGGDSDWPRWQFGKPENFSKDVYGYADQVHYLNGILRDVIDEILAKSETPPIIIVQGDHGLRLSWWEVQQLDEQTQLDNICLRDLFTNLSAVYLPDEEYRIAIYDSMSPVNTFRLVFDSYFGSDLGMLEDRSFFTNLKAEELTMSFIDVTGEQDSCSESWDAKFRGLH
jgi:hypothetical protein